MTKHGSSSLRALIAIGACATSAVFARQADAAMMTHSDLSSLAFEADAVVRARRTSNQHKEQWLTLTETVIEKTYKGALAPGDHLMLDYGLYRTSSWFGGEDAGVPGDEVVIFLELNREAAQQRQWDAGPVQDWYIESSGLRVELGGVIQRFEQESNPGGFSPVVQGHDPYDLVNDPRGAAKLTWTTFEPELLYGLGRAAAVRDAITRTGTPQGRDALIEMLGPADPDDPSIPMPQGYVGFYRDQIADAIVARIAAEKDVTRTLAALVRAHGAVDLFPIQEDLPRTELARIASDTSVAKETRVAAIALIARYRGDPAQDTATVIKLLSDPEPDVRVAAARAVPWERQPSLPFPRALAKQFRAETDDRVLYEQVRAAKDHELASILTGRTLTEPLVSATRAGRVLSVGWETLHDRDLHLTHVDVTASGASQRTLSFGQRELVESRTNSSGRLSVALAFDPPLALGRYDLACDVTLESGNGAQVRRHFTLAPLVAKAATPRPSYPFVPPTIRDAGAPAAPVDAGPESPLPAPVDASPPPRPIDASVAPPRPSQGCGCSAIGQRDADHAPAALAYGLLGAALLLKRGHSSRARR